MENRKAAIAFSICEELSLDDVDCDQIFEGTINPIELAELIDRRLATS